MSQHRGGLGRGLEALIPRGAPGLQEIGIDPTPASTPDGTANFLKLELIKWAPIIQASGAQLE